MHVTNKAGDSLATIEDYINKQYPGDKSFTHRGGKICKFPPGHRIHIAKLIQTMKDVKKKSKLPSTVTGKKRSHDEVNVTVSKKVVKGEKQPA